MRLAKLKLAKIRSGGSLSVFSIMVSPGYRCCSLKFRHKKRARVSVQGAPFVTGRGLALRQCRRWSPVLQESMALVMSAHFLLLIAPDCKYFLINTSLR